MLFFSFYFASILSSFMGLVGRRRHGLHQSFIHTKNMDSHKIPIIITLPTDVPTYLLSAPGKRKKKLHATHSSPSETLTNSILGGASSVPTLPPIFHLSGSTYLPTYLPGTRHEVTTTTTTTPPPLSSRTTTQNMVDVKLDQQ